MGLHGITCGITRDYAYIGDYVGRDAELNDRPPFPSPTRRAEPGRAGRMWTLLPPEGRRSMLHAPPCLAWPAFVHAEMPRHYHGGLLSVRLRLKP